MRDKLFNVIFPIWFLIIMPQVWLIALPANFIIDSLVLLIAMAVFKVVNKKEVYKKTILKVWIFGFVADIVGALILFLTQFFPDISILKEITSDVVWNPFKSIWGFLYVSIAVLISAVCIYYFNFKISLKKLDIDSKLKRKIAVFLAIFTAPYLFFYPSNAMYLQDNNLNSNIKIENTYLGNTLISRIFAESVNYTNTEFKYNDKIAKVKSEIESEDKSVVTTEISLKFDNSDINEYIKWAKQCSLIVLIKNNDINTVNVNLVDGNENNKELTNLVINRNELQDKYNVDLKALESDSNKLDNVLNKIKQGE